MKALIVDDEPGIRLVLSHYLRGKGYEVREADDGTSAVGLVESFEPDLVFLDQVLPDMDGEDLIHPFSSNEVGTSVVVMTAHADVDRAVRCMRKGADYFFQKPLDLDHVSVVLEKIEEKVRLRQEATTYRKLSEMKGGGDVIIGTSPAIREVKRLMGLLAKNASTPVLVLGESGTGKELVARAIHALSAARGPLMAINCASLNENLLESELFGHQRGSFTDARHTKKGLFEVASEGSIFFDELGEMPLSVQAKLLRVLDSGTFRRIGGNTEIRSDARLMAATNRDVDALVSEGQFREDLYYRLNVFPIRLPPLRERNEDVIPLAQYFLASVGERMGRPKVHLAPEAAEMLRDYPWPGNVRELRNVIERSIILCGSDTISPEHLPLDVRGRPEKRARSTEHRVLRPLREVVDRHITAVVSATPSHSEAARVLEISRSTLLAHLKRLSDR